MSEGAQGTQLPNTRRRVLRYLLPLVLIGLAVHVVLPQLATLQHSLAIIQAMLWWAVGLAVMFQVLSYLGSGYLMKVIVALEGLRMSVMRGTIVSTAATSLGLAEVARWEPLRQRTAGCAAAARALKGPHSPAGCRRCSTMPLSW